MPTRMQSGGFGQLGMLGADLTLAGEIGFEAGCDELGLSAKECTAARDVLDGDVEKLRNLAYAAMYAGGAAACAATGVGASLSAVCGLLATSIGAKLEPYLRDFANHLGFGNEGFLPICNLTAFGGGGFRRAFHGQPLVSEIAGKVPTQSEISQAFSTWDKTRALMVVTCMGKHALVPARTWYFGTEGKLKGFIDWKRGQIGPLGTGSFVSTLGVIDRSDPTRIVRDHRPRNTRVPKAKFNWIGVHVTSLSIPDILNRAKVPLSGTSGPSSGRLPILSRTSLNVTRGQAGPPPPAPTSDATKIIVGGAAIALAVSLLTA